MNKRFWAMVAFWLASTALCLWIRPSDVREYQMYAVGALRSPLLHVWPREYPMLSLALFVLPRLLPLPYRWAFAVLTGAALWWLWATGRPHPAWQRRLLVYLAVGTAGLFAGRYDAVPAMLLYLAVEAGRAGRYRSAWAWSIFGFLLKLFPAVVWPALIIAEWRATGRWRWDRGALAVLSGLASIALQAAFSQRAAFSSYRYLFHRPLQFASLPGGLAALTQVDRVRLITGFGSINVAGPPAGAIDLAVVAAAILALLAVWKLAIDGRIDFVTIVLASLTILVLGSKVFSAQYLIWLAPLWAKYPLRWQWVTSAALTTLGYPVGFILARHFGPEWLYFSLWIDLARNMILLWGTATWFRTRGYWSAPDRRLAT